MRAISRFSQFLISKLEALNNPNKLLIIKVFKHSKNNQLGGKDWHKIRNLVGKHLEFFNFGLPTWSKQD